MNNPDERKKMPSINEILSVDRTSEFYQNFIYDYGTQLVGREKWNQAMSKQQPFSKVVTSADEAYLILAVLNNWNKMVDSSNLPESVKAGMMHTETLHRIDGKVVNYYTERISQKEKTKSPDGTTGKPGGRAWSSDGVLMYKQLQEKVKATRRNDKTMEDGRKMFDAAITAVHIQRESDRVNSKSKKRKRPPVKPRMNESLVDVGVSDDEMEDLMKKCTALVDDL